MTLRQARVVDLSSQIAGPYCTKLLADAGADVVKVEAPTGDPLRRWTSSGADPGNEDSALFRYLNTSKRSITGTPDDAGVRELLAVADAVVEDLPPGEIEGLRLHDDNPGCVVVSVSPFGHGGPWAHRPANEFTLQAWCGSIASRGTPDRPPVQAGGRLGEWIGGAYAAVAAAAALRNARRTGRGEHVDLSLLECMSMTMNTYSPLFASLSGVEPSKGPARTIEIPSVEPTSDGYVGFCTITAQQLRDFWVLIERPELIEDPDLATAAGRTRRMEEVLGLIHTWTEKHTTEEIIEAASLMRIPVAPIGTGATVASMDHFVERGTFVANPRGGFLQPRVPYRIGDLPAPEFAAAPRLGEHDGSVLWPPRDTVGVGPAAEPAPLPLEGIAVVDFTMFWAGPAATQMLAALGADVVKVESVQRPDGMRFTTVRPPSTERWWEWCPIFHGANTGKRSVTLDLTRPEGRALAEQLIADADAVVENFSPRVMENFGLDWDAIAKINPRAVMVRMPAFGLTGPWRERTGFAQTMEQVSGMAWVTGFPDRAPLIPRGACDPLAGMHAVLALMLALENRERSGSGALVEVTMVEAALNVAADQVVEHSAYGQSAGRKGNRSRGAAPQGVYPCRGQEQWLALSVSSDAAWQGLQRALGFPAWSTHPALATPEGRHAAHDRIDDEMTLWTRSQAAAEAAEALAGQGVAAAVVVRPVDIGQNPQMRARGFFEPVTHPVVGTHDLPGMPFRFAGRPGPWLRRPAPTLGQHNDEVLGLSPDARQRLWADQVIGDRPVGA